MLGGGSITVGDSVILFVEHVLVRLVVVSVLGHRLCVVTVEQNINATPSSSAIPGIKL